MVNMIKKAKEKYPTKTVTCYGCGSLYQVPLKTEAELEDYVCRRSCADKTATK